MKLEIRSEITNRNARIQTWIGEKLHGMSLFQRFLILGAIIFIGLLALVVYVTQEAARSIERRITQERLVGATVVANSLDEIMRSAVAELQVTANTLALDINDTEEMKNHLELRGIAAEREGIFRKGLVLLDTNGNVVAHAPKGAIDSYVDSLPVLVGSSELSSLPGGFFLSRVFIDSKEGSPRMAVMVSSEDAISQSRINLLGLMNPMETPLSQVLLSSVDSLETGHAEVLDGGGVVFMTTEEQTLMTKGDHPTYYDTLRGASNSDIKVVKHEDNDDVSEDPFHLMAYVPLSNMPWALSIGGSEQETFAPVRQFQRRIYGMAGIVMTLAIFGGAIGILMLVRPVHVLSGAARRMASEDLDNPIVIKEGGEIGDLAEDMERMRVRLRTSIERIQELNADLEQKVSERTQEVEQQNKELRSASFIAETATSFLRPKEVLEHTLKGVEDATGQRSLAIFLVDGEGQNLTLAAGRGLPEPFVPFETSLDMGHCNCGWVARFGQETLTNDITDSPDTSRQNCRICAEAGFKSVASFPLRSQERIEGVLAIFSTEPNSLSKQNFRVVNLICNQVGLAIHNTRLYEELEGKEKFSRGLLEQVINAQEEERKRLARELHDDTGQNLTGILLGIDGVAGNIKTDPDAAQTQMADLRTMAQGALAELRKMVLDLRPSALDDLGLVPAVRRYALQHLEPLNIEVEIDSENMKENLTAPVQTLLFRVVQEAINNIARHSKASHVTISFWKEDDRLYVSVIDDGVGFDQVSGKKNPNSTSLGLIGMQERASLVDGSVTVISKLNKGPRVLVCIPLVENVDDDECL